MANLTKNICLNTLKIALAVGSLKDEHSPSACGDHVHNMKALFVFNFYSFLIHYTPPKVSPPSTPPTPSPHIFPFILIRGLSSITGHRIYYDFLFNPWTTYMHPHVVYCNMLSGICCYLFAIFVWYNREQKIYFDFNYLSIYWCF